MAINLSKEEAVKRVNLNKQVMENVLSTLPTPIPNNLRARVGVCLDISGSMGDRYRSGEITELLMRLLPIALQFDDNGELDFWLFSTKFWELPGVTINNINDYVERVILPGHPMGGTFYAPVIKSVIERYTKREPVDYPSLVLFITDGDSMDNKKTYQLLTECSDKPIFWIFVGLGDGPFKLLSHLDTMSDRYVDNANFFSVPSLSNMPPEAMYTALLQEYPIWLNYPEVIGMFRNNPFNNSTQGGNKFMAVSLSKGGKVSLSKVAADAGLSGGLTSVTVGLGWDTNRYDGGAEFDLDASAFLTGADGKCASDTDFVFYNNPVAAGVKHTGDNRTGAGDGDDEQIIVDLNSVPDHIQEISFTVTIDQADVRNQNFGMVENAYVRVFDTKTNTELIKYDLGEDFSVETAIVAAKLYRNNGEWKFNAIGSGFAGGLAALCKNFGINV